MGINVEQNQTQVRQIERRMNSECNSILHLHLHLQQCPGETQGLTTALPNIENTACSNLHERASSTQMKKKVGGMSKTDMEFQELKGFTELGFQFSKDELSPGIMNLLPGLKHLIIIDENDMKQQHDSSLVQPPPHAMKGEEMKRRLKLWARCVASIVKC